MQSTTSCVVTMLVSDLPAASVSSRLVVSQTQKAQQVQCHLQLSADCCIVTHLEWVALD